MNLLNVGAQGGEAVRCSAWLGVMSILLILILWPRVIGIPARFHVRYLTTQALLLLIKLEKLIYLSRRRAMFCKQLVALDLKLLYHLSLLGCHSFALCITHKFRGRAKTPNDPSSATASTAKPERKETP